jgi:hypothetical protein
MGAAILCQRLSRQPDDGQALAEGDNAMRNSSVLALAVVLACAALAVPANAPAQSPAARSEAPQAANASRTPEKRAEKQPKPRKSKKTAR